MGEYRRLDPDSILRQIQETESRGIEPEKGILKVYLGYCAGVGKTYRMLQQAKLMQLKGIDVVIGYVETHRREDTEAMKNGLETVAMKRIDYQGLVLEEMDTDAIIRRKPYIVLVDELAHTNVSGSRHNKRYQDIEELIAHNINVMTAFNVQHIQSVSDIVTDMTGIQMKEIVPDSFMNLADEIELVDVPIEEMLRRLEEGKVYIPEKAKQAMMEYFKKSNLMGLRELALRYTARQVSENLQTYMNSNAIRNPLPVGSKLLVAIGAGPGSQKLIRIAHRMAIDLDAEWTAITVETPSTGRSHIKTSDPVTKNILLAESLGAKTANLVGEDISDEIAGYARAEHFTLALIGYSQKTAFEELIQGSIINKLVRKIKPVQLLIVDTNEETPVQSARKKGTKSVNPVSWLISVFILAVCVGIEYLFKDSLGFTNIALILTIPSLIISLLYGMRIGIPISLISIFCLNFFFIEPYFTLAVQDLKAVPIFFTFLFVSGIASFLSDRIRWRVQTLNQQQNFLNTIYHFSRELLSKNRMDSIAEIALKNISVFFKCEALILIPNSEKTLKVVRKSEDSIVFSEIETSIASWVYANGKPAGIGTDTLSSSKWLFQPLMTGENTIGVLAILRNADTKEFTYEEMKYLDSFMNIAALSLSNSMNLSSSISFLMKSLDY